jgi:flagellar hook-basal body complex protein FliE
MSDPLGFISRSGASAGGVRGPGGLGAPAGQDRAAPGTPSFKDLLMENIKQVNSLQQDATRAVEDLQAGRRNDVEGVMLATQKADTAFRMLVSLRSKMQQAVEEIKQMRV